VAAFWIQPLDHSYRPVDDPDLLAVSLRVAPLPHTTLHPLRVAHKRTPDPWWIFASTVDPAPHGVVPKGESIGRLGRLCFADDPPHHAEVFAVLVPLPLRFHVRGCFGQDGCQRVH